MKKQILFIMLGLLAHSIYAQTNLYEHPDFDQIAKSHEVISIIPFKTSITLRPKQMKDITPEQLDRMEKAEGESIQSAMYSWFLKRKKRGTLSISVQNPATTNTKLKKSGITSENFENYTPSELADILEVDAIIMGTYETNKPMSEGASVALGLLIGLGYNKFSNNKYEHL